MKTFFLICGICCFIAIFRWPIEYYTFLRIIVFIGSSLAIYCFLKSKKYFPVVLFFSIAILFNPVFPIYLYVKRIWMVIDIITGILFLMIIFKKEKTEESKMEETAEELMSRPKTFQRDRIINPKKH